MFYGTLLQSCRAAHNDKCSMVVNNSVSSLEAGPNENGGKQLVSLGDFASSSSVFNGLRASSPQPSVAMEVRLGAPGSCPVLIIKRSRARFGAPSGSKVLYKLLITVQD